MSGPYRSLLKKSWSLAEHLGTVAEFLVVRRETSKKVLWSLAEHFEVFSGSSRDTLGPYRSFLKKRWARTEAFRNCPWSVSKLFRKANGR